MKWIIERRMLWLAPALLATTLLAYSDDRRIEAHPTAAPIPTCSGPGSDEFVPGSRRMPMR